MTTRIPPAVPIAALALMFLVPTAVFSDTPLTPTQVVSNAAGYEGKPISVSGKTANLQSASTIRGKYTYYQLCDGQCVSVIDATNPSYPNGQTATASGTFQQQFKGPKRTFKNVIVVK